MPPLSNLESDPTMPKPRYGHNLLDDKRRWSLRCVLLVAIATSVSCSSTGTSYKGGVGYTERGSASWYGPGFHGNKTANGETYDMDGLTAAHQTLPFETVVEVRNRDNGQRVRVRINDRGPFVGGRIIDLSRQAAREIDMLGPGTARVKIRVVSAPPPGGSGVFWVQAGAFQDADRARALYRDLEANYSQIKMESEGGWHRVRLGPYSKKKQAEKTRRDLRYEGISAVVLKAG